MLVAPHPVDQIRQQLKMYAKKKFTTHIYVKDHKEVFILCKILFENKKQP